MSPLSAGACRRSASPATFWIVSAIPPVDATEAPPRGDGPRTLGDLLYQDPGRARIAESEWIGLLRAIAAGQQWALYDIYARMHRIVFTSIVRIVKTRETAEELTIDVFHDVWRRAARYEPASGTVAGWIMNQARSRAIDRLRFEQRKKRTAGASDDSLGASTANGAEALLEEQDRARRLKAALATLKPAEREAIETAYFSECTYLETALKLKQPVGTVKTRIRSALTKLRHAMAAGSGES